MTELRFNTQNVGDKLAIAEQLYRYCRSVDRLDIALGHSVFHPDSYADFGLYKGTGRGWIDFICQEHRRFLHHSHQVTNIIIEVMGDSAGSESYVTATLRAREGAKLMQRQFWARYVDRWSRRDSHWAIDRRECVIDFASIGEVSALGDHQRSRRDESDPSYEVLSEFR
jgi:hypothetical protein